MIRINLLPVEKRKKERTPLPRFGLVLLDAAVLTAVLFYCFYLFIAIRGVETSISENKRLRDDLQGAVNEHKELTAQVASLQATLTEIETTTKRSIEWWRAMDALWEVIHFNPRVWVSDISTMDDKAAASAAKNYNPAFAGTPGYGISLRCHCAGKDVTSFTKFRMDLKRSADLKKYFTEINWDAQWQTVEEKEFVEGWSMNFDVRLIGRYEIAPPTGAATTAQPGGRRGRGQ